MRREWFLARRAAAYRPATSTCRCRAACVPLGPHMRHPHARRLRRTSPRFYVLDDRQYRSPQACPRPARGGGNTVDVAECAELADPQAHACSARRRSNGSRAASRASRARWNVIAQQTLMAQFDRKAGPGPRAWTDGWDGYPAARRRLLEFARRKKARQSGGDRRRRARASTSAELKADFDDPSSPVVASEFVGTSITSQHGAQERLDKLRARQPARAARRRPPPRLRARRGHAAAHDGRPARDGKRREARAACSTLASFVVEDGKPGPQRAALN